MNNIDLSAIPDVTYRLQFSSRFTFRQAAELVDYLATLGISHCYTSPYLKARKGSPHGYDVVDHRSLNPELGTREDYEEFLAQLQRHRIKHILDFVPNHMGIMGNDNLWWLDVLENGPGSFYADFFDIDWKPLKPELQGKVLLPILGDHYGNVLENGQLILQFDAEQGEFFVSYYEHRLPIDPREYPRILNYRHDILIERLGKNNTDVKALEELSDAFSNLPHRYESAEDRRVQRRSEQQFLKKRLNDLCNSNADIQDFITANVALINGRQGYAQSFDGLHALLEAQAYRLAYWQVAGDEINYRRFFDINLLAGIRVEEPRVFEMTHAFIFELIAERRIHGLRIDHIDGLNNPLQYLQRLYQRLKDLLPPSDSDNGALPFYTIVEKILATHEHLDEAWPVAGTTGYEFTELVNGVFVAAQYKKLLSKVYNRFIGFRPIFDEIVYLCKKHIISVPLASEVNVLAIQLSRIAEYHRYSRDYTFYALRDALQEIVACFPVYRTYIDGGKITRSDRQYIEWAVSQARQRSLAADLTVFDFIRALLLQEFTLDKSENFRQMAADFTRHLQQYTAPVMAKGFEDTALYKFCLLLSLNDVGGNPQQFGSSLNRFHYLNQERQHHWPHTMLNLSTHDSKRNGDVRARINVLSEIPYEWQKAVKTWNRINRPRKRKIAGQSAPSRNDEYLFYQTLVGSWPIGDNNPETMQGYVTRIQQYMRKAVREAKLNSSWRSPQIDYETALTEFIAKVMDPSPNNAFLQAFEAFHKRILNAGLLNSLAQQQLLLTVPGVPDIYQGNEVWNFSLVDPDNRQPVDFALRRQLLDKLKHDFETEDESLPERLTQLTAAPTDGRIKLYLIWKTLQFRQQNSLLFKQGRYQPLTTEGALAEHLLAFARIHQQHPVCIVVVPRLTANLDTAGKPFPLGDVWADTRVQAPLPQPSEYYNVLTGEIVKSHRQNEDHWLDANELLVSFPTALLVIQNPLH